MYPQRFRALPAYAFPRLRALLDHLPSGGEPIAMTIGEPQHAFPEFVPEVLAAHVLGFNKYPPNDGAPELLEAIASWVGRRFGAKVDAPTEVLTLNGTREGLYNVNMALCPESKNGQPPVVLIPNPFYQVYAVSTLSASAEPVYVNATAETGFLPDYGSLPEDVLKRTAMCYICSPANPQGAVATESYWRELIGLAERFDFKIIADECYSEVYRDAAPTGALEVAQKMGADPERVLIFHSLSKRSNLAGLRSGFVVSGPQNIARMKQLRNYAGTPLPLPLQHVAVACWNDETHVAASRALYAEKFDLADEVFAGVEGYQSPEAGFFLWLPVEDAEAAAVKLWMQTGVRVLPGSYLSRDTDAGNPGQNYIRVALVAPKQDVQRGLIAIRDCIYG